MTTTLQPLLLDVYFDHACPFSCMLVTALCDLQAQTPELEVRWHPVPLASPAGHASRADVAMHAQHLASAWPAIAATALSGFGLALNRPERAQDGRIAAAATHWVRAEAKRFDRPELEAAFHAAVCRAAFLEGREIGDPDVLSACAEAVGLPGSALRQALQADVLAALVGQDLAAARSLGVLAVPAIRSGAYAAVGASSRAVLRQTIQEAGRLAGQAEPSAPSGVALSTATTSVDHPERQTS